MKANLLNFLQGKYNFLYGTTSTAYPKLIITNSPKVFHKLISQIQYDSHRFGMFNIASSYHFEPDVFILNNANKILLTSDFKELKWFDGHRISLVILNTELEKAEQLYPEKLPYSSRVKPDYLYINTPNLKIPEEIVLDPSLMRTITIAPPRHYTTMLTDMF